MKVKVVFFENNFLEAIGAGIYEISILRSDGVCCSLYKGESVHVLKRCGQHLFRLKNNPGYLGFDEKTINDDSLTLTFKMLHKEHDSIERKKIEKLEIKNQTPLSQSGRSDFKVGEKSRIEALQNFLYS